VQEQQKSDQQESTNRSSQTKSLTKPSTTQLNKTNSSPATIKLETKANSQEKKKCC